MVVLHYYLLLYLVVTAVSAVILSSMSGDHLLRMRSGVGTLLQCYLESLLTVFPVRCMIESRSFVCDREDITSMSL